MRVCTSAPPSSSAVTSSPVAAFTSGGPPRKMVPRPFTITASSLIAGAVVPPAAREPTPITAAAREELALVALPLDRVVAAAAPRLFQTRAQVVLEGGHVREVLAELRRARVDVALEDGHGREYTIGARGAVETERTMRSLRSAA